MTESDNKPIAVLSETGEVLHDLVNLISSSLDVTCEFEAMNAELALSEQRLLLIDCRSYTPSKIQNWLNSADKAHLPPVALFNTAHSSAHETLLEWPCVRGFFYRDTKSDQIVEGLRLILEGDFWVPRRLLHAYLERNRRPPTQSIKAATLLTKRERQILKMMENGATNAAMAESMSVSEHTVKTHLYNIYRKIDVGNRIEAINWSRQNLSGQSAVG